MSTPFAQPSAGGDQFDPRLYKGHLLLFVPSQFYAEMPTKNGASAAADTDIIALELIDAQTGKPTVFHNARVFGNLATSVRGAVGGGVILGRLDQGPNTKGNPPWILTEHTEAEAQASVPVYDAYKRGEFVQPSAPAQVAPQQYGGPPVAQDVPPWGFSSPAAASRAIYPNGAPPPQGGSWEPPYAHPTTTAPAVPVTPAPAAIPAVDPQLVAFLNERGVQVPPGMTQETAVMLANTYTGG